MRSEVILNLLICILPLVLIGCNRKSEPSSSGSSEEIGQQVTAISDEIWVIFQDSKGQYWFGSNGEGVFRLDGRQITAYTTKDGLVSDQLRGIQEDSDGNIYFDTPTGVSRFDGKSIVTLPRRQLRAAEWRLGPTDLWFNVNGEMAGALRYHDDSLSFLPLPTHDLESAFGIQSNNASFTPYGVYSTYEDNQGNMWFGTLTAGVFRFDGQRFLWFSDKELGTLDDGRVPAVRSIIEYPEGTFWLSNAISKYRVFEEIDSLYYSRSDGIPKDIGPDQMNFPYYNSAVVDNEGVLWIQTYGEGIWKYNGETLENFVIEEAGQNVHMVTMYKDNSGKLWIGSQWHGVYVFENEGFTRFNP